MAMAHTDRKPRISWVVVLGAGLAVASALVLIAAPVGYRLGIVPLRVALLTLLKWGVYGGIAAAVVSLIGLVMTLVRPREVRRGTVLAAVSLLVGLGLVGALARFRMNPPPPPIHDITTDTDRPPQFVSVVPLRAAAPNRVEYGGPEVAAQQRQGYPDVQPLTLPLPPNQAFDRAFATARRLGWEIVASDPPSGRIEATDTTFWFGFKDDVVIRVTAAPNGSRVDVRSLSRVGLSDVGTNAARIRKYLAALRDASSQRS